MIDWRVENWLDEWEAGTERQLRNHPLWLEDGDSGPTEFVENRQEVILWALQQILDRLPERKAQ